jgi:penicillin-binding protein 2
MGIMYKNRIQVLAIAIFISFVVLLGSLFYFQILHFSNYRSLGLRNTIRMIPLKASRGTIYDRDGVVLARDEMSFDLVAIPQEIDDVDKTFNKLSLITGKKAEVLKDTYRKNYRLPFVPTNILIDLGPEQAFSMEERLIDIPGVMISVTPRRKYPHHKIASHIIGYIGRIADSELKRLKDYGYSVQDMVGKSGIEKYYDAYLKGEDGGIQVEVDSRSREVSRIGLKKPEKGKDIYLTIDLDLQNFLSMILEDKKGACAIMQVETGRILALASSPGFDPNIFVSGKDRDRLRILSDNDYPMLNRALSSAYPAGSTFKIPVACAGIATGYIKNETTFFCDGVFKLGNARFRCWKESGHGYQDVVEAIAHSCNVFFYNLGKALGADQIYRHAILFGLGDLTGIDLPEEVKGIAPSPRWKRSSLKQPWYEGDTINYSIGQGYLLVTPLQMLKVITITANKGYCPQPYILEKIEDKQISSKKEYHSRLRPETFDLVHTGLFDAVNDQTGTGQRAGIKDIEISGKTGTAQAGGSRKSHAWFIGYLPSKDPLISMVVFIEHGGKGGEESAGIARLIALYLKENDFLKHGHGDS